ncbi:hypothetical protein [Lentibacter sp.]|uniref:hypothetical protein n=1 Tax=Lentibacter sp. TaxID=2024994 RepID=UPI003F6C3053
MTRFTIASFNVKNLIGPDKEYYQFQSYTPEEYAWKEDWLADQLLSMDAAPRCHWQRRPLLSRGAHADHQPDRTDAPAFS